MIRVSFLLLDRLFPPSFDRIVAGLQATRARLTEFAAARHRAANGLAEVAQKRRQQALAFDFMADGARIEAQRASRVRDRIAALTE